MASILIDEGHADLELTDTEGRTALHVAAWQGYREMVEVLLSRGADPNAMDAERRTPVQSAAWMDRADVVRVLVERGAKVDHICAQGATALSIAAQEGHDAVVRVLLDHGADVNHLDVTGRTPLHVATKGGHSEVVSLLRAQGSRAGGSVPPFHAGSKRSNFVELKYVNPGRDNGGSMGPSCSKRSDGTPLVLSTNTSSMVETNLWCRPQPPVTTARTNTLSTNQSSSSSGGIESHNRGAPLSFTQQLQKCTESGARRKTEGRTILMAPGYDSSSGGVVFGESLQSPGSPFSEVHSCKASPAYESPIYDSVYNSDVDTIAKLGGFDRLTHCGGEGLTYRSDAVNHHLDGGGHQRGLQTFEQIPFSGRSVLPYEPVWQQRNVSDVTSRQTFSQNPLDRSVLDRSAQDRSALDRSGQDQSVAGVDCSMNQMRICPPAPTNVASRMSAMVMGQAALARNSPKTNRKENGCVVGGVVGGGCVVGGGVMGVSSTTPLPTQTTVTAEVLAPLVVTTSADVIANPGYAPLTPPGVNMGSNESLEDTFGTATVMTDGGMSENMRSSSAINKTSATGVGQPASKRETLL